MVDNTTWEKIATIAKAHAGQQIFTPWKKIPITREVSISKDLNLNGESAYDFLEEIMAEFPTFEINTGRGDFVFDNYFQSEISQSFSKNLIYLFYRKLKTLDESEKTTLTLGMLEDAVSRGFWETARYL